MRQQNAGRCSSSEEGDLSLERDWSLSSQVAGFASFVKVAFAFRYLPSVPVGIVKTSWR